MATGLLVVMGAVAVARAMAVSKVVVQYLAAQVMERKKAMAVSKVVVQALVAQVMERKRVMEASRVAAALAMAMSKVAAQALVALAMAMGKVAAQALVAQAMAVSKVAIPPRAKPPTRLNRLSLLQKNARALRKRSLKFSGRVVLVTIFGMGGLPILM